ncbi:hypothetical protein B0H15DRAFT_854953 [Mycena belliarum]|uniref:Probable RNA polymerase II nuclear localization protein SLC7A6OS n=1 Tax=Mycena belliarum TaxID=1033014 RepID=A0AAD6XKQ6_9AGAR|nr:hypothetical protein B0H15DRAFT_854953 [Mycena belliae]
MDVDAVSQSYTILRIKRKRNEEPLDALVVESRRRKKSRGGVGVFQFAQTVEADAFEDEKRKLAIQDQVSRLARESASNPAESKASSALSSRASPSTPKDDPARRYRIIPQEDEEEASAKRRLPTSPPKVISAKDLPPRSKNTGFKLYDAVLAADKAPAPASDEEMEKFIPMLDEYLRMNDIVASASVSSVAETLPPSASSTDEYVWDVFYHRPATLAEWNEAANVGTLTGLPPSITDPYDSASDSEEEDEADEDSNAEEYYKNDYPDEYSSEDDDSGDEFHEDSGNESPRYDDGSDHEWR